MKQVSQDEYRKITNCTGWFNLYHFTMDEVNTFLNSKGYDVIVHRAEAKTQMMESEWGTGSVRKVGVPIDMMRDFVIAVKPGQEIPQYFSPETIDEFEVGNVFQRELKKKILS